MPAGAVAAPASAILVFLLPSLPISSVSASRFMFYCVAPAANCKMDKFFAFYNLFFFFIVHENTTDIINAATPHTYTIHTYMYHTHTHTLAGM